MTYIMGDYRYPLCGCLLVYDGEGGWNPVSLCHKHKENKTDMELLREKLDRDSRK